MILTNKLRIQLRVKRHGYVKTADFFSAVQIAVEPVIEEVLQQWFEHEGTPTGEWRDVPKVTQEP